MYQNLNYAPDLCGNYKIVMKALTFFFQNLVIFYRYKDNLFLTNYLATRGVAFALYNIIRFFGKKVI